VIDAILSLPYVSLGGRRRRGCRSVVDELLDGVAELIWIGTNKALQRQIVPDEDEGRRRLDVVALSNFLYVVEQGNTPSMISIRRRHDRSWGRVELKPNACT